MLAFSASSLFRNRTTFKVKDEIESSHVLPLDDRPIESKGPSCEGACRAGPTAIRVVRPQGRAWRAFCSIHTTHNWVRLGRGDLNSHTVVDLL